MFRSAPRRRTTRPRVPAARGRAPISRSELSSAARTTRGPVAARCSLRAADAEAGRRLPSRRVSPFDDFFPHDFYRAAAGPAWTAWQARGPDMCAVSDTGGSGRSCLYGPTRPSTSSRPSSSSTTTSSGTAAVRTAGAGRDGNLVLGDGAGHCTGLVSDVVQRIARRREHKTQIEKRFEGWPHMLLNAVLDFAREQGREHAAAGHRRPRDRAHRPRPRRGPELLRAHLRPQAVPGGYRVRRSRTAGGGPTCAANAGRVVALAARTTRSCRRTSTIVVFTTSSAATGIANDRCPRSRPVGLRATLPSNAMLADRGRGRRRGDVQRGRGLPGGGSPGASRTAGTPSPFIPGTIVVVEGPLAARTRGNRIAWRALPGSDRHASAGRGFGELEALPPGDIG